MILQLVSIILFFHTISFVLTAGLKGVSNKNAAKVDGMLEVRYILHLISFYRNLALAEPQSLSEAMKRMTKAKFWSLSETPMILKLSNNQVYFSGSSTENQRKGVASFHGRWRCY